MAEQSKPPSQLVQFASRENGCHPCTSGKMRRFMLGNMNPNMAAAAFCPALLSSPRAKCRQNMAKRMENSMIHDTCFSGYSSDSVSLT